jgi:hypothetical protein
MRTRLVLLVALALAASGCKSLFQPMLESVLHTHEVTISGKVEYPDGTLVPLARVVTSTGVRTHAYATGEFLMTLAKSPGRIRIDFQDGDDPNRVYAETHSESVEIVPDHDQALVVVLRHSDPI